MQAVTLSHFVDLAAKIKAPGHLVVQAVKETVTKTLSAWRQEKNHLPLSDEIVAGIDAHMRSLELCA